MESTTHKKTGKMVKEVLIKTRDKVVDIARGVCIIIMILRHAEAWWGKGQQVFKYAGVFFLVFFFFCSGLFYNEPKNKGRYLLKRFYRLEIPYMIVCLMVLVKRYYSGVRPVSSVVYSFFYALPAGFESPYLLFGEKTTGIGPAWFLNCLFVSSCIYVGAGLCLRKITYHRVTDSSEKGSDSELNTETILKTIVIVILAVMASISQKYVVLPFNIQDGLIGVMFLHLGVLAAPYVRKTIAWARMDILKTSTVFIVLLFIYYLDINYVPYQWLDLGRNKYNPQSLLGTCLGFLLLILASVLLEKVKWVGHLIAFIGLNSMIILIIHSVDIIILRDWSQVSWPFVFATFVVYVSATYVYVELKKVILQKRTTEKWRNR